MLYLNRLFKYVNVKKLSIPWLGLSKRSRMLPTNAIEKDGCPHLCVFFVLRKYAVRNTDNSSPRPVVSKQAVAFALITPDSFNVFLHRPDLLAESTKVQKKLRFHLRRSRACFAAMRREKVFDRAFRVVVRSTSKHHFRQASNKRPEWCSHQLSVSLPYIWAQGPFAVAGSCLIFAQRARVDFADASHRK